MSEIIKFIKRLQTGSFNSMVDVDVTFQNEHFPEIYFKEIAFIIVFFSRSRITANLITITEYIKDFLFTNVFKDTGKIQNNIALLQRKYVTSYSKLQALEKTDPNYTIDEKKLNDELNRYKTAIKNAELKRSNTEESNARILLYKKRLAFLKKLSETLLELVAARPFQYDAVKANALIFAAHFNILPKDKMAFILNSAHPKLRDETTYDDVVALQQKLFGKIPTSTLVTNANFSGTDSESDKLGDSNEADSDSEESRSDELEHGKTDELDDTSDSEPESDYNDIIQSVRTKPCVDEDVHGIVQKWGKMKRKDKYIWETEDVRHVESTSAAIDPRRPDINWESDGDNDGGANISPAQDVDPYHDEKTESETFIEDKNTQSEIFQAPESSSAVSSGPIQNSSETDLNLNQLEDAFEIKDD